MRWTITVLDTLCEIVTKGTTPTTIGDSFEKEGIPFLRVQNIKDGKVNFKQDILYIDKNTNKKLERSIIKPNDVLITIAGTIGRSAVVPENAPILNCNQAIAIIRLIKEKVYPKFFCYWLNSSEALSQIGGAKVTATISNLSLGEIRNIKIPLPPLNEQKRIAAVLDKADRIRQLNRQLVAKYESLTQSVFLEMFGDPESNNIKFPLVKMSFVLDLITYGLTVRPKYVERGIPLISAKEIRSGKISFDQASNISADDFNSLSIKAKPRIGDVLFSKTGSIGHCAVVESSKNFAITQNAARLSFNKQLVNSVFALTYLKSDYIQRLSQSYAKGNAVKDLQLGDMKGFNFLLPPLEIQEYFARIAKNIESQKAKAERSLKKSEELFNVLLQKAFLGELFEKEMEAVETAVPESLSSKPLQLNLF